MVSLLFQSYRGRKPLGAVPGAGVAVPGVPGLSPGVPAAASPSPAPQAPAAPSPSPATTPGMKQEHSSQPMVCNIESILKSP